MLQGDVTEDTDGTKSKHAFRAHILILEDFFLPSKLVITLEIPAAGLPER